MMKITSGIINITNSGKLKISSGGNLSVPGVNLWPITVVLTNADADIKNTTSVGENEEVILKFYTPAGKRGYTFTEEDSFSVKNCIIKGFETSIIDPLVDNSWVATITILPTNSGDISIAVKAIENTEYRFLDLYLPVSIETDLRSYNVLLYRLDKMNSRIGEPLSPSEYTPDGTIAFYNHVNYDNSELERPGYFNTAESYKYELVLETEDGMECPVNTVSLTCTEYGILSNFEEQYTDSAAITYSEEEQLTLPEGTVYTGRVITINSVDDIPTGYNIYPASYLELNTNS